LGVNLNKRLMNPASALLISISNNPTIS